MTNELNCSCKSTPSRAIVFYRTTFLRDEIVEIAQHDWRKRKKKKMQFKTLGEMCNWSFAFTTPDKINNKYQFSWKLERVLIYNKGFVSEYINLYNWMVDTLIVYVCVCVKSIIGTKFTPNWNRSNYIHFWYETFIPFSFESLVRETVAFENLGSPTFVKFSWPQFLVSSGFEGNFSRFLFKTEFPMSINLSCLNHFDCTVILFIYFFLSIFLVERIAFDTTRLCANALCLKNTYRY